MTSRADAMHRFIQGAGWGAATRASLAGDASNRRYDRLNQPDGRHAVLMDAPPQKGEDVRPFVQIADYLCNIGLSAPQILARDEENGFLLLEDLGDSLFARVLNTQPDLENRLYTGAVDVLLHLNQAPPPSLPEYDSATMGPLSALAFEWYLDALSGPNPTAKATFLSAFTDLLAPLDPHAKVLIQRDYHAENLLWLPERQGAAQVGLLDFQDAVLGHPAYDLVSVMQDARRDLAPDTAPNMIRYFLDQSGHSAETFDTAYALLGAQRNLRILGVFARLCIRDGKAHYVDLIPRVWGHIQSNLSHPALAPIATLVTDTLPPPTAENLDILRSKCATYPKP